MVFINYDFTSFIVYFSVINQTNYGSPRNLKISQISSDFLPSCHDEGNRWSNRFPNLPCGRHCGAPFPVAMVTRNTTEKIVIISASFIT